MFFSEGFVLARCGCGSTLPEHVAPLICHLCGLQPLCLRCSIGEFACCVGCKREQKRLLVQRSGHLMGCPHCKRAQAEFRYCGRCRDQCCLKCWPKRHVWCAQNCQRFGCQEKPHRACCGMLLCGLCSEYHSKSLHKAFQTYCHPCGRKRVNTPCPVRGCDQFYCNRCSKACYIHEKAVLCGGGGGHFVSNYLLRKVQFRSEYTEVCPKCFDRFRAAIECILMVRNRVGVRVHRDLMDHLFKYILMRL